MSFKDLIKNAIFEEEPQQPGQPVRPLQPPAGVRPSRPSPSSSPSYTPSAGGATVSMSSDNEFYARLAKQTDLSTVPELAKIESFAAPLTGVIPDKTLRYKAAMATAQSQAGLTKAAVLRAFDTLLSLLESSAASFDSQTNEVAKTEVDSKTGQIADLNAAIEEKQKEIADMQQQVKSLQAAAETTRTRLQKAKAGFAAAYERRKSEIQQQRKDFENLLQ